MPTICCRMFLSHLKPKAYFLLVYKFPAVVVREHENPEKNINFFKLVGEILFFASDVKNIIEDLKMLERVFYEWKLF